MWSQTTITSSDYSVVSASFPAVSSLAHIRLTFSSRDLPLAADVRSRVVLTTRQLIFTEADLLAAPEISGGDEEPSISIVLPRAADAAADSPLLLRLRKLGLRSSPATECALAVFRECLSYTLTARLAPQWNRVGAFLVQGRDFLTSGAKLGAVQARFVAGENQLTIALRANRVRLIPIKLKDLGVAPEEADSCRLTQSSRGIQDQAGEETSRRAVVDAHCHVLPTMGKGRIVAVSKRVPLSGGNDQFSTYRDLKRYWKNSYGYRLPDDEDNDQLFFFRVRFWNFPGEFTYPSVCVRQSIVEFVREDPAPIISDFLHDLKTKVATVCGHVLDISPQISYPSVRLEAAGETDSFISNITSTPPAPKKNLKTVYPSSTSVLSSGSVETDSACHASRQNYSTPKKIVPIFKPRIGFARSTSKISPFLKSASPPPKVIPSFTRRIEAINLPTNKADNVEKSGESRSDQSAAVPMKLSFAPKRPPASSSLANSGPKAKPSFASKVFPLSPNGCHSTGKVARPPSSNPPKNWPPSKTAPGLGGEPQPPAKKPRAKPRPQEGVDVAALAAAGGTMSGVTVATLAAWLSSRGVTCKAKDKKPDLIRKIYTVLGIPVIEREG